MLDKPEWGLAQNHERRSNVRIPPGAIQSQEQLARARDNNTRRNYGREIVARLESPELSDSDTYDIVNAPPPVEGSPADQELFGDHSVNDLALECSFADHYLDRLFRRDGVDYCADYLSGWIPIRTLRDMAAHHELPPVSPPASPSSADDVNDSDPESLGHNVTTPNTHPPGSAPAGPRPIATNWRGNNAWPGITIAPQAGTTVQSRFAGDGYNPPTHAADLHAGNQAPATQPVPLHRTDRDTIVPGAPHPTQQADGGLAVPPVVPASGVPVATTHPQTNLGHVVLPQPGGSTAPPTPMTPTAHHYRKDPPPLYRQTQTGSQPAVDSNTTSGSVPIATPTPAGAPFGVNLTASYNNQSIGCGSNIHSGQGDIHFITSNNTNNQFPPGHRPQATHRPQGPTHSIPVHDSTNLFFEQLRPNESSQESMATGALALGPSPPMAGNVPQSAPTFQPVQPQAYQLPSMADCPMPVAASQPGMMRNNVPAHHQATLLAQSAQLPRPAFDSSAPQAFVQPQVHLGYHQMAGVPPLPDTHPAQLYAQLPVLTGYGLPPQAPGGPEYPQVLAREGAHYASGPQYHYNQHAPNVPLVQPLGAHFTGYQNFQPQMGPVLSSAPGAPQVPLQVASHAAAAVRCEGAAAPPAGSPMDLDVGNGNEAPQNPPGGNERNI